MMSVERWNARTPEILNERPYLAVLVKQIIKLYIH